MSSRGRQSRASSPLQLTGADSCLHTKSTIWRIEIARSPRDLDLVRALFLKYAAELNVDLCFQGFEQELATLPGRYAAPEGRLFLASLDDEQVGCVGLRPLDGPLCELKRLYVRPQARGHGLGRSLTALCVDSARAGGYDRIVLDTLEWMEPARALYTSFGFRPCGPYYRNPLPDVVYLEASL